jgi:hypothetical protein
VQGWKVVTLGYEANPKFWRAFVLVAALEGPVGFAAVEAYIEVAAVLTTVCDVNGGLDTVYNAFGRPNAFAQDICCPRHGGC